MDRKQKLDLFLKTRAGQRAVLKAYIKKLNEPEIKEKENNERFLDKVQAMFENLLNSLKFRG